MDGKMLKTVGLLLFFMWFPSVWCEAGIVPKPLSVIERRGTFRITPHTRLYAAEGLESEARLFMADIVPLLDHGIARSEQLRGADIVLRLDSALEAEEYLLQIAPGRMTLSGGTPCGVFYALQSLRQLIAEHGASIPALEIHDKPDMVYRGAMLDVSRHFFPVEEVKRFIDLLALHKLNRFHWHLTDDQGWRIEIRRYPRLTEIGSQRRETLVGVMREGETMRFDHIPYGGYYTQDEVREIVSYAAARHIEVIPEIDMPGHGMGALAAYPWLGCTGGPYEVWTRWGVSEDLYCAGRETTFTFIEHVLSEILALFPSRQIHIGGDECPVTRWQDCPQCRRRMQTERLADETALRSYFVRRIQQWLQARGREIIGWDELLEGELSSEVTLMVWRDPAHAYEAIRRGCRVILSPKQYCYLDYSQTADPVRYEPPCHDTRYVPLRQVYRLEPFDRLRPEERSQVLGVQGNVWTEYMPDMECVEFMILPRLAALAEVGWACERKCYSDFMTRMPVLIALYEKLGYRYADYVFRGIE